MSNERDERLSREPDERSTPADGDDLVRHHAPDDQSPSQAVVTAVAALRGCDPLALAPLYSTVDPDALDGIVSAPVPGAAGPSVTFEYGGATVDIRQGSRLTVVAAESSASTTEPPLTDGDGPDGSRGG